MSAVAKHARLRSQNLARMLHLAAAALHPDHRSLLREQRKKLLAEGDLQWLVQSKLSTTFPRAAAVSLMDWMPYRLHNGAPPVRLLWLLRGRELFLRKGLSTVDPL